jgi:hypothetical protein
MEYSEKQEELRNKLLDLMESYKGDLPSYEVVFEMITLGTSIALNCAPNVLVGIKTVLTCMETAISSYQETHS